MSTETNRPDDGKSVEHSDNEKASCPSAMTKIASKPRTTGPGSRRERAKRPSAEGWLKVG